MHTHAAALLDRSTGWYFSDGHSKQARIRVSDTQPVGPDWVLGRRKSYSWPRLWLDEPFQLMVGATGFCCTSRPRSSSNHPLEWTQLLAEEQHPSTGADSTGRGWVLECRLAFMHQSLLGEDQKCLVIAGQVRLGTIIILQQDEHGEMAQSCTH